MSTENTQFKTISVIGLGYIGLPTAATLATRGPKVVGVDVRESVVDRLNAGKAHFSEPDLDILLDAAVKSGMLHAAMEPKPSDAFIVAVPTPFNDDKSADLSFVERATRTLASVLKRGDLVILESTSPVGTTQKICDWISEERPDLRVPARGQGGDIYVAYCPERILPGRMVFELVENDRVVGGMSEACAHRAEALYKLFVRGAILQTDAATAEFVKLIENAYRDVNIGFANELSILCEKLGLNVWDAIGLANRHPRVNILSPSVGVGGHCIAIDPWFLISAAPEVTPLMYAARRVNDSKPLSVLEQIRKELSRFKKPIVACLGLAYKPDIDDLRESPALQVTLTLGQEGFQLRVVEPHVEELPQSLAKFENVQKTELEEALTNADVVVVLVGHSVFKLVPREVLLKKIVIDTVGLWQG